jgi:AcrR family transcriptional regulator
MPKAPKGGSRARPGGHQLRPEVIAHHQRQRILAGAAKAIAAKGYRDTSVADIVKSAAIARARFYENFSSKEDCFFALYDAAAESTLKAVAEACETAGEEFPARVRIGLEAMLEQLAADPELARAFVVEGPAVGPAINERFERLVADFAALLRKGRPQDAATELPETVEETVVGGLYWLLYYALLDGRPKRIQKLLPQLTEFSLIPFSGGDAATASAAT